MRSPEAVSHESEGLSPEDARDFSNIAREMTRMEVRTLENPEELTKEELAAAKRQEEVWEAERELGKNN